MTGIEPKMLTKFLKLNSPMFQVLENENVYGFSLDCYESLTSWVLYISIGLIS